MQRFMWCMTHCTLLCSRIVTPTMYVGRSIKFSAKTPSLHQKWTNVSVSFFYFVQTEKKLGFKICEHCLPHLLAFNAFKVHSSARWTYCSRQVTTTSFALSIPRLECGRLGASCWRTGATVNIFRCALLIVGYM